ncbi:hypothetical protein Ancab_006392 [Ancistrocladus abbreviatus]
MQHTSSTNFHDFHRGPGIRDAFNTLGESIFNLDGHEWTERRKIYRSFFNIKEFSSLVNQAILDKVERSLVPVLDHFASPKQSPQATVDLQELFQRFSFDTTCCFGLDSLEFKPERWITEKGELKHEPAHKFPAFNAGPRICLGKDITFMETKAVAATIVHNYNVQIARGQDTRPTNAIIIKMKDGLHATISKRWS